MLDTSGQESTNFEPSEKRQPTRQQRKNSRKENPQYAFYLPNEIDHFESMTRKE
jgi:hypothetical protein